MTLIGAKQMRVRTRAHIRAHTHTCTHTPTSVTEEVNESICHQLLKGNMVDSGEKNFMIMWKEFELLLTVFVIFQRECQLHLI